MHNFLRLVALGVFGGTVVAASSVAAAEAPASPGPRPVRERAVDLPSDGTGNTRRLVRWTGHVSNYDESKVGRYTLPDPLVLANGQRVRDAETWFKARRPELLRFYESEIFGRVPATAPKVTFTVLATEKVALNRRAVRKHVVGRLGSGPDAPVVDLELMVPSTGKGPFPILLNISFDQPNGLAVSGKPPATSASVEPARYVPPLDELISRGYGYAAFRYTDVEGDAVETSLTRLRRLTLAPGQERPAADEWGTIAAWAWGASRVLDFLETEPTVDAKRVAVFGHSRLGKTALWASATDPRFALVFASCSGEGGAALARRDFGETVDDLVANFPYWFAEAFQKYPGRWEQLPVDAHTLISLSAPRPVFLTGGTRDLWADPKGGYLAAVAANPVYELLGRKGVAVRAEPPLDQPLIEGDVGYLYRTGAHVITVDDWSAFFRFAERYLKPVP